MKKIIIQELIKNAKSQQILLKELTKYSQRRTSLLDGLNNTFRKFLNELSIIRSNESYKTIESLYKDLNNLSRCTDNRGIAEVGRNIQMCSEFITKYKDQIKELEKFDKQPFPNWFFLKFYDERREDLWIQERQELNDLMSRYSRR